MRICNHRNEIGLFGGLQMKNVIMLSSLCLFLIACGNDQVIEEESTVEAPTGNEDDSTEETSDDTQQLITVAIEFEIDDDIYDVDEDAWEQRIEISEGTTLLELMQEHYDIEEENGMITSIEGYSQDENLGAYWMFDINDQQSTVGAGEYVLQDGDEVEWELDD